MVARSGTASRSRRSRCPATGATTCVAESAQAIAAWFGTVVVYEDDDLRGRAPGEMRELIGTAMRAVRPGIDCEEAENPADALRAALAVANGAPVLFVYEKLALAHDALLAVGAQPWPEASRPATAESVVAVAETMTKEVASALGAAPDTPAAVGGTPSAPTAVAPTTGAPTTGAPTTGAPITGGLAAGATALLPHQPVNPAEPASTGADTACDCDPLTRSAWPRLPGGDGSADYGGACGCQPAG